MLTETINPRTAQIDRLSTAELIRTINEEDQQVADAVAAANPAIVRAVDGIVERFQRGGRLIYIGAGTSGRLGVLDASECVPTFSVPAEMVQGIIAGGRDAIVNSIEDAEDRPEGGRADLESIQLSAEDTVVGIAASGTTPYVIGALEYANEIGTLTVGVSCNEPAPLLETAQIAIAAIVGPEVVTGSTRMKSGTATKMILNMLSTASMIKLGKVYGNLMVDVKVSNQKLAARARRIIQQITGADPKEIDDLLTQADQEVKTVIVMYQRKVSADEARSLLQEAHGFLREIIG